MARLINRLASMFLDHISMTFILIPFMMGHLLLLQFIFDSSYPDSILINRNVSHAILFLPILIYLLKDSYKGKSIGKRVIGLQVINRSTNTPANPLQCFIRNLLIPFIWPLEVLISLFSPTRRFGDLIANTKVVIAEKEKTMIKS